MEPPATVPTAAPDRDQAREQTRFDPPACAHMAWSRYAPLDVLSHPALARLEAYLCDPAVLERLEQDERRARYPHEIRQGLARAGLGELFAGVADDPTATAWHLSALNLLTASRAGTLGITVGVNSLALISAYLAADDAQLETILGEVRRGAFSSLVLSELEHGSNLLRTQARAEPGARDAAGGFVPLADPAAEASHYRLSGEKQLINGGNEHQLLFTLLRTRPQDPEAGSSPLAGRGAHSLFCVPRQEGVEALARWSTLPARGADISGIRFNGLVVPARTRLGGQGEGFTLIQKTLSISRGGVAALAAGTVGRARQLAWGYAARRDVYGRPVATLGAIADHLIRLDAYDRAAAAASLRATAWVNARGLQSSYYTALGKLLSCNLAERGVEEGRRVLGGRALLSDLPFERLVRDVTLFGVFDGTSHVMLEELQVRLNALVNAWTARGDAPAPDTLPEVRAVYATPPRSLREVLRTRQPRTFPSPVDHLACLARLPGRVDLDPTADLAEACFALVATLIARGDWRADHGLRLELAGMGAQLEVLAGLVELYDPDRRPALIERRPEAGPLDAAAYVHTIQLLAGELCAWVDTRRAQAGLGEEWLPRRLRDAGGLGGLRGRLLTGFDAVRKELAAALAEGL